MRVIITGSSGLLGSEFVNYFSKNDIEFKTLCYDDLCEDFNKLKQRFNLFLPDVIIHCAANTNVEWCETNKLKCYRDNVLLTEKLCNLSQLYGCKFVLFSSTGIYGDWKIEPYTEFDLPVPTTIHHKSKYVAEQKVQSSLPNSLILRVGWLFGGNPESKKNFIINRIKEFNASDNDISSNCEQYGSPTYVIDVVETTLSLISMEASGVFNCVNQGKASRYDYVNEIAFLLGVSNRVKPAAADSFSRVAKVSNNEMATNEKLSCYGIEIRNTWQTRLKEYIEGIS